MAALPTFAAVVGLLLMTGGCGAQTSGSSESGTASTPVARSAAGSTARRSTAARALVNPHWTSLPAAPIAGRSHGVSAWTGSEMIVWGGMSAGGEQYFADGAAYNAQDRTWQKLPPAPLSPRSNAASVWTGHSLFIWGGNGNAGRFEDGAVYAPATRVWTKLPDTRSLPAVDSSHLLQSQALWTGSAVALLVARSGDEQVEFELYDPDRNTWTVEPAIRTPAGHPTQLLSAAAVGPTIYLFSYWADTRVTSGGTEAPITGSFSTETTSGIDGFSVDSLSGRATANALAPPRGTPVGTSVQAAGSRLLFPPGQPFCGFCAGGFVVNRHGLLADPATGKVTELPHGPIDDLGPQYIWTGKQILAYDTQAFTSGPGDSNPQYPGKAAVFNPTSGSWKVLPSAPLTGADGASFAVWTGTALIEWGDMYLPMSANTGKTTFQAAGLELTG